MKNAVGKAVNFGTGEAITVNYIAKKVKEISGSNSKITHIEDRAAQVPKLLCNYSLAKKLFKWKPKVFIDEGLRRNIEWVKQKSKTLDKFFVDKTSIIASSAKIGNGTKIWAFVQIGENAKIGKNCVIGNGAYIDRNVVIGNNVKVHNKALLYDGLIIEIIVL